MEKILTELVFLLLLNNLFMLGAPGLRILIGLCALQGVLLAALTLGLHHGLLGLAVFCIKGALLPILLMRAYKRLAANRAPTRHLNRLAAIFLGLAGFAFSLWLETRLPLLPGLFPRLLLPTALTTLFCGLLLVIGRATALSQVIGYLAGENGIFLLGIPLMAAGAIWFELALLLDVFVAVCVMGIAIGHLGETFESMDTGRFRDLKD